MTISTAKVALNDRNNSGAERAHDVEITLVSRQESARKEIERFIRTVFRRAYGARVNHFPPHLLCMRQDGRVLAALGLRPAEEAPLFLEAYLDKPIENRLAEISARPIDRSRVIEVGSLASSHGGGARALIITLTAYLSGASYEWAVFTATPQVRNSFVKLGIELTPLAQADKSRLKEAQYSWGSYYDQHPMVVACDVRQGFAAVHKALESERLFPTASQLWDDAIEAGRLGCLWQPPRTLESRWPAWMLPNEVSHSHASYNQKRDEV
ncbi:MAG TPA: thermostable hemolysin [Chromatiales bacterium]|nr:thermostable hemolysin [Chromatiales bacterium]